jgi:hypothetical protein
MFQTKALFIFCLLLSFIGESTVYGQLPAKEDNKVGFRQEYYGGLNIHSRGWGINFNYAKFATYKSSRLYTVDFVSMKHHKEVKTRGYLGEKAPEFVYGKLNNFSALRLGMGKKFTIAPKIREKGVQVSLNLLGGVSLGFLRPVYLEVLEADAYNNLIYRIEKYNPEVHNITNIYGKARGNFKLSELKVHPGLYAKVGLQFEYGEYREFIRAIEVGAALDAHYQRIPIMAGIENPFLFPSVYLNLHIGSRNF